MFEKTDKKRIYWLIEEYLSHKIDTQTFCDEYYYCYDLQVDRDSLNDLEIKVFFELSNVAARVSIFEEDFKNYPGAYYNEDELREKVAKAKLLLQ